MAASILTRSVPLLNAGAAAHSHPLRTAASSTLIRHNHSIHTIPASASVKQHSFAPTSIPCRSYNTTAAQSRYLTPLSPSFRTFKHPPLSHRAHPALIIRHSSRSFASGSGEASGHVLVLADHNNSKLGEATLHILAAAQKLKPKKLSVLIAGSDCKKVAEQAAKLSGVNQVIVADDAAYKHRLAENVSKLLHELGKSADYQYEYLLASGSSDGKNIIPRVGALLDVQPISDVSAVEEDGKTFVRPIYAGNVYATVTTSDAIKLMTIRTTQFDVVESSDSNKAEIKEFKVQDSDTKQAEWVKEEVSKSDRPELGAAKVVVSGGRGLKSGDNFAMLYDLADLLGGAVGASRAAVDAGYVANELQVGQTGKVVAPELYIAVGISGAIQHLAGMKDSKVIVAINKDGEAPIFQVADYGLVDDLFKAVPALTKKIKDGKES